MVQGFTEKTFLIYQKSFLSGAVGGYLYMVAKDEKTVLRIRKALNENPLNDKACFVNMELSRKGFQVSRS